MSDSAIIRFWDTARRTDPLAAVARTVSVGFIAGLLGMLLFHEGTVLLLHHLTSEFPAAAALFGRIPAPDGLALTSPLWPNGVVRTALWGGTWGIVLAAVLRRQRQVAALLSGFCFGALLVTLVELTLVPATQGLPILAGGDRQIWWRLGIANAAWGWGTALMLLLALPRRG